MTAMLMMMMTAMMMTMMMMMMMMMMMVLMMMMMMMMLTMMMMMMMICFSFFLAAYSVQRKQQRAPRMHMTSRLPPTRAASRSRGPQPHGAKAATVEQTSAQRAPPSHALCWVTAAVTAERPPRGNARPSPQAHRGRAGARWRASRRPGHRPRNGSVDVGGAELLEAQGETQTWQRASVRAHRLALRLRRDASGGDPV